MNEIIHLVIGDLACHDKKIDRICRTIKNQARFSKKVDMKVTLLAFAMLSYIWVSETNQRELSERIEKLEQRKGE